MALNAKNISDTEFFYGHKACAGCGGSLAVRMALKVLGERSVAAVPACCMSAVAFNYPQLCFGNNAIITPFAATASVLTGIQAGLKAKGVQNFQAVGFAGDGGTADIGIQALSGAIDRNDDILYICYDNEAYMNTGIQNQGLRPFVQELKQHRQEKISADISDQKRICLKLLLLKIFLMRQLLQSVTFRILSAKWKRLQKFPEQNSFM